MWQIAYHLEHLDPVFIFLSDMDFYEISINEPSEISISFDSLLIQVY